MSKVHDNMDFLQKVSWGFVEGYSSINKFGENPDVDTGTTPEVVWDGGDLYNFCPDTGTTLYFSSSDATDDQIIYYEGLDENFLLKSGTFTIDGQTKTAIPGTFTRIHRLVNRGATDLVGMLYVYEDDTVVGGVPSTSGTAGSKVRAQINDGNNQTMMCVYTTPANMEGLFLQGFISIARPVATVATFTLRSRIFGSVFAIKWKGVLDSSGVSALVYAQGSPEKIPPKTDIIIRCDEVSANNVGVTAAFDILLREIAI